MTAASLSVIVLAAGKGSRMHSRRPKVLHPVAGRPMLFHVLDSAAALAPNAIHVVYGHGGALVPDTAQQAPDAWGELRWVHQDTLDGTGGAVARALPAIPDADRVLVLCGDVPLIRPPDLEPLTHGDAVTLLTAELPDPTGYGRIVRGTDGTVERIVEHRDATALEREIAEINSGILAAPARWLKQWVNALNADNAQGEYYLTDIVALAGQAGVPVHAETVADADTVQGVNDHAQRAQVETALQRRGAEALMRAGLAIQAPERLQLRGQLTAGFDCTLEPDVVIEGDVVLGDDVSVGTGAILRSCRLGDGVRVEPYTLIEGADLGPDVHVGPFARLRPGTQLGRGARIGNFVETKNATFGPNAKANHLAYIGDAVVGARTNLGAGTITCNYDGREKHRTEIGDDAFIGSDTQLVAPVRVGDRALIGAGTTLTRDAPPGTLTLSRVQQWSSPLKRARLTAAQQPPEHEGPAKPGPDPEE